MPTYYESAVALLKLDMKPLEFIQEHSWAYKYLGQPNIENSWKNTVLVYCFQRLIEGRTQSKRVEVGRLGEKRWKDSWNNFCEYYSRNRSLNMQTKTFFRKDQYLFMIADYYGEANSSQTTKTKVVFDGSHRWIAIILDREKEVFHFLNVGKSDYELIRWWIKNDLPVKFGRRELRKLKADKVDEILSNLNVYEVELNRSNFGTREGVVLKSKRGAAWSNLKELQREGEDAAVKSPVTVYDLVKFNVSKDSQNKITFKVERKKHKFSRKLWTATRTNSPSFPDELKEFYGDDIFVYDDITDEELVRRLLSSGLIDLYEYRVPIVQDFLSRSSKFLTAQSVTGYRCPDKNCPRRNQPYKTKGECECGKTRVKFRDKWRYELIVNLDSLRTTMAGILRDLGFVVNYKERNYLRIGEQNVIEARNRENNRLFFITFSQNAPNQTVLRRLRFEGVPVISVSVEGNVKSTIEGIPTLHGYEVITAALHQNSEPIERLLTRFQQLNHQFRKKALEDSTKLLEQGQYNPNDFEGISHALIQSISPEARKWGGPNLPDGAAGFSSSAIPGKTGHVFWDAKRYDSTSLQNYDTSKDVDYIVKLNRARYLHGLKELKYYVFITSNTTETEFSVVKNSIAEGLKNSRKQGSNKIGKISVGCLNRKELIPLAKFLSTNYDTLVQKSDSVLGTVLADIRTHGYFRFSRIENRLKEQLKEATQSQNISELRKVTATLD